MADLSEMLRAFVTALMCSKEELERRENVVVYRSDTVHNVCLNGLLHC